MSQDPSPLDYECETLTVRDYADTSTVTVQPFTESDFASWKSRTGSKVIESGGRYWLELVPGFYTNLHPYSRMTAAEAKRPSPWCWGYNTALRDEDEQAANATWPLCVLSNLPEYDRSSLRPKVRASLARSHREARFVRLDDTALLREQGYGLYLSATGRLGIRRVCNKARYLASIERRLGDPRVLMVGALVDNRLAGYCESYAVEDTCYATTIYVGTEYTKLPISLGLQFETLQVYKRSGCIVRAVNGADRPEREGLMTFKQRMGFEVVSVPARFEMVWLAKMLLQRTKPLTYYRLTGNKELVPTRA